MGLSVAFFGSGSFAEPIVELLRARGVLRLLVTQDEVSFWEARVGGAVAVFRDGDKRLSRCSQGEGGKGGEGGGGGVDVIVTASYGRLLSQAVLSLAPLGGYNVHASLLPRWRGAAPIQHAILHGDRESGVSLIRMNARIDCGGVVLRKPVSLCGDETYGTLERRLSRLGADAVSELLERLVCGEVSFAAQDEEQASYAPKLRREDSLLDWREPALRLERQVRAFSRWPGSCFVVRGERIVVHAACLEASEEGAAAGTFLRARPHPVVACGEGALGLLRLQRAGRKILDGAAFVRGFRLSCAVV